MVSDNEATYNLNKKKKKKEMANIVDGFDYKFNSVDIDVMNLLTQKSTKKQFCLMGVPSSRCRYSRTCIPYKVAKYYNVSHWNIAVGAPKHTTYGNKIIYWLLHRAHLHVFPPPPPPPSPSTRVGMYLHVIHVLKLVVKRNRSQKQMDMS